ncbi:LOW QUALITY PROTEIN: lamina-associated polypeptide 2, isoforms alpha/zeta-like [Anomaloglossus baeobatrachus]
MRAMIREEVQSVIASTSSHQECRDMPHKRQRQELGISSEEGEISYDSDSQLKEETAGPAPEEGRRYLFSSCDTDELLRAVRKTMMVEEQEKPRSVQDEMFGGLRSQRHRVFPVNPHVRAMVMEEWQESEKKLVIPREFRARLPFELDDIKDWEDVPKIDVPVAKVARKTAIPFEDSSGLKDPMDRKADGLLKRAWEAAAPLSTNIAATSVARSMSRWLDDLESLFVDRAPRETVQDSISLLKLATGFMADASAESIRFSARNEALTNSARRAIWLKTWSGDCASKNKLCAIPFSGVRVFGPALDDILEKESDKKGGFPEERSRRGPPTRRFRSFRNTDYKSRGKTGRWSYYKGGKERNPSFDTRKNQNRS